MIQMNIRFFNVECIHGFTYNFVVVCSATSYPFGIIPRIKLPPIENLKFIVSTLSNQDKKVAFVWVDKDGSLARSSEFMKKCHNMNNIVETTDGDVSSHDGNIAGPNKTLANITRYILLNSSHKKEPWCF